MPVSPAPAFAVNENAPPIALLIVSVPLATAPKSVLAVNVMALLELI